MPKTKEKAAGVGKKRALVFLLLALTVVGVAALAGYTFYQLHNMKSALQTDADQAAAKKAVPPAPPIYMPLDPFTVSLLPEENESDRVLYIGLTLRLKDEKARATLQPFLPEIRSRLLLLFSQQTGAALATASGKIALRDNIKQVVNQPLADGQSVSVTDVLFNAFILR